MSQATITVEGFIGNELEVKTTNTGKRVLSVSVAHTPQKRDGDQWVDVGPTTWFEASFWDEHVDAVLQTVEKGALVVLSGRPEVSAYSKRDGQPGAKILVQFPQLSVVVRRPRRGTPAGAPVVESQGWAEVAPDPYDDGQTPF